MHILIILHIINTYKKTQSYNTIGKIYSKQMVSINLQIFESVIFSQDANSSLILHNSIIILEEQHLVSKRFIVAMNLNESLPKKNL